MSQQVRFHNSRILFVGSGQIAMHDACCCCPIDCPDEVYSIVTGITGEIYGVPDLLVEGTASGLVCTGNTFECLATCPGDTEPQLRSSVPAGACTDYDEYARFFCSHSNINGTWDGLLYPGENRSLTPFTEAETQDIIDGLLDTVTPGWCARYRAAASYRWMFPYRSILFTSYREYHDIRTGCVEASGEKNVYQKYNNPNEYRNIAPDAWGFLPWWAWVAINPFASGIDFEGAGTVAGQYYNPPFAVPLLVCSVEEYESRTPTEVSPPASSEENVAYPCVIDPSCGAYGGPAPCTYDYTVAIDNGTVTGTTTISIQTAP